MDKIKTQDCYLPVYVNERLDPNWPVKWIDQYHWLEKHTDMVVLTKEQYLERIKDAMNYMCTPREYLETIFK